MKVDRKNFILNGGNKKDRNRSQTEENDPEATKRREEKIVHSCCSFQSRMGPPEYRKWRRVHGLQLPLHPQQVGGWMLLLAVGAATFLVLLPALRPFFRECLFIVLAALFSIHILSHLAALLLDPADPELRALKVKVAVPEFDRSKHAHVIENGRCHLCNIKTSGPKTKHCSVCNKCIDHFDHHCKWLNHCIGGRNYVPFLICVVSAVAASLVVVGVSVLEIVYYHVDPGLLNVFANPLNETKTDLFLPDSVFLGIVSILGLLAAATAGLLLHLCLFHCYISVLGITTYEYIRNYRQEPASQRVLPLKCQTKNSEVLTNNLESLQRTRCSKFRNCCYYSCSRPPEDREQENCCLHAVKLLKGERRHKRRPLQRQNTDPEFVDRVIKPFLITLSDEKNSEGETLNSKPAHSYFKFFRERKPCCNRKIAESENIENVEEDINQEKVEEKKEKTSKKFTKFKFRRPKILRPRSAGSVENSVRIKHNQIRPSTAEELNRNSEKSLTLKSEFKPEGVDLKSYTTMKTQVLPELNESLKKLRSAAELKELSSVLDLVEQPNFALQVNMKSNFRKTRKKNIIKRPRTPPLSPIRESGLSNPGSPRVDLIMPPTPVFVRPSSPETSTIFLSNPNSSSSSDDESDIVTPPVPIIQRRYRGRDVLETPQLPRKMFSAPREDPVFILNPSRLKSNKWIDVEIRND